VCTGDRHEINDSLESFPSGHSVGGSGAAELADLSATDGGLGRLPLPLLVAQRAPQDLRQCQACLLEADPVFRTAPWRHFDLRQLDDCASVQHDAQLPSDRCRTNFTTTPTRLPEASLASFALSPRIECTTIPARSLLRSLSLLMGPPVYDWRVNHIPLPIVGSNVAGTHPLYGSHALRTNEPFGVNEIASGSNEKALPANGARHGV
jgi:hypothetical protein